MIEATGLGKTFGTNQALDAMDLQVPPGEVYALLGANGAGKTTTINLLLGFLQPDAGQVRVAGFDPAAQPEQARAVTAYIPEQVALYPSLSGLENLAYFAALAGRALADGEARALLQRAGLAAEAAERRLGDYSKGMRQKVGIAIALAKEARVLVLDEPMSGLDPQAANEFCTLVRQLADAGSAVLMATHDIFRARQLADRIGILRAGRKRAELRAAELDAQELQALYLQHMGA
jgi:ABC-2 type transport system ATP-binding protein